MRDYGMLHRLFTREDRSDGHRHGTARRLDSFGGQTADRIPRRAFIAEVATALCDGNPRQAERRFGWGRETVAKGLHEAERGMRCLEDFAARGCRRSEDQDPQLAADIRAIVEPHTYADPELKSQGGIPTCPRPRCATP